MDRFFLIRNITRWCAPVFIGSWYRNLKLVFIFCTHRKTHSLMHCKCGDTLSVLCAERLVAINVKLCSQFS